MAASKRNIEGTKMAGWGVAIVSREKLSESFRVHEAWDP